MVVSKGAMKKPNPTYNGGKEGNGTYQNIINHIPKCNRFVEAFAGNCAIARKLKLPDLTVINDLDSRLYEGLKNLESSGVIVTNICYTEVVKLFDREGTFFYFDPPYLFSTRRSQKRLYTHEFTDEDHGRFLQIALSIKSNCMISHYPCPLYNEALSGWRTFDFESSTRNGMRTERIYMNYPEPTELQDYRYIGKDYTRRQQIKRKVQRLIDKLDAMTEHERNAILTAVIAKYNYATAN